MGELTTAAAYLRDTSLAMRERYVDDCVTHACRLVALLLAEGRSPWIGRLKIELVRDGSLFHGPLIPKRFTGAAAPVWNTHYVACADGEAYDPIVGRAIAADGYAIEVFGTPVALTTYLDREATALLAADGGLRRAMTVGARNHR